MRQLEAMFPVDILLVEDNPGDARLAIEALKDGKVRNRISSVTDGEHALRYLNACHPYTQAVRPEARASSDEAGQEETCSAWAGERRRSRSF